MTDGTRRVLDALPTTCIPAIKNGRTVYEYGDPAEVSYVASVRKSILSLLYGRPDRPRSATPERGTVEPGAEFHYTAWDAKVLGTIYEQQTGRRVFDAVAQDLAGPLEFQDFDPAGNAC